MPVDTVGEAHFLIIGLGNPGDRYTDTRHNLGFAVVDELARRWHVERFQSKFKSAVATVSVANSSVVLVKPQTFMNLSGEAVQSLVAFYKVPLSQLLVVVDDLDLPVGALRLRLGGGSGGHNGLKSIAACLGSEEFARLRLGVGRSQDLPADVYLLSKIAVQDRPEYQTLVGHAANDVEHIVKHGVKAAMNQVNQKKEPK